MIVEETAIIVQTVFAFNGYELYHPINVHVKIKKELLLTWSHFCNLVEQWRDGTHPKRIFALFQFRRLASFGHCGFDFAERDQGVNPTLGPKENQSFPVRIWRKMSHLRRSRFGISLRHFDLRILQGIFQTNSSKQKDVPVCRQPRLHHQQTAAQTMPRVSICGMVWTEFSCLTFCFQEMHRGRDEARSRSRRSFARRTQQVWPSLQARPRTEAAEEGNVAQRVDYTEHGRDRDKGIDTVKRRLAKQSKDRNESHRNLYTCIRPADRPVQSHCSIP